jgi:spore maturation protein CgeB
MLSQHQRSGGDNSRGSTDLKLLIVGNGGGSNVGASFARACNEIGTPFVQIESNRAMRGPATLRRLVWRLRDHQPMRLGKFSTEVVDFCRTRQPDVILTMGTAPLTVEALAEISKVGCYRVNYLTDDPWNPSLRSKWFLRALAGYDHVFTTRRANIGDLEALGVRRVSYLPFAWDPILCPEQKYLEEELQDYRADIMFAGGGDADRVPYFAALARAGFSVALYGGYWDRFAETRTLTRGQLPIAELPKAIAGARIALCLVRRANRDGHCMRTFEVPAAGGCMLTEETEEHREILGRDGECVLYFRTVDEMIAKARLLCENPAERTRLAAAARARIRICSNTYKDRLIRILAAVEAR